MRTEQTKRKRRGRLGGGAEEAGAGVRRVLAVGAHPDDIEFGMAGTLRLLVERGWEGHYLNLSTGSCGSRAHSASQLRRIRGRESRAAAGVLGARYHGPMADDLEILYTLPLLRKLAAVVRQVGPSIVLTHSPQDYMEDHTNTARLAVSAAFARGMPNFRTVPAVGAVLGDVTVYHAMPHGLCDGMRVRVEADLYVDTSGVLEVKRQALGAHASQGAWLDATQGMDSWIGSMVGMSEEVGRRSGRFRHAEGWRRRLHLGFCAADADPLRDALGDLCCVGMKG